MIEDAEIDCPWCGEPNSIAVDITAGDQAYTEDCAVCCQPIFITINADPENGVTAIAGRPENE